MTCPHTMVDSAPDSLLFARFTKVIAVLDVVESVRLMEQDEHGFIRRWHSFVEYARQLLPQHGGRMHKSLGDGLMLEFGDARGCIKTLFAMHEWCNRSNEGQPRERHMDLRAAAHLASFVSDEYDIYGTDVNLAARISTLAGPGEIVVSPAVRDGLTDGLDADIEDLGECFLKHVKEPVRAYRIGRAGPSAVIKRSTEGLSPLHPTVAVIPFSVHSGEAAHQMLGEALADEVIAGLSRTPELSVISRLSTTIFGGRREKTNEIGPRLGATYILAGRCRTDGRQVVLFVELVEAASGHIVWADTLKGAMNGIFVTDDGLIEHLVSSASSAILSKELSRVRSHSLPTLENYTLMLGAVGLMHRTSEPDSNRARIAFEALIERARRHPLPYAWLAMWHVLRVQQGWSEDIETDARSALDCTRRALDLDPECTLALTADGFVHTNLLKNLEVAEKQYRNALSLNPNEPLAWLLLGTLYAFKGNGEAAVEASDRALSLSPLDPLRYFYDSLAASAAISAGQYARAAELAKRSLKANRTHTSTLRALAIAQSLSGELDEARETVRELLRLEPSFSVRTFLERSPSSGFEMGRVCADALSRAGLHTS